MIKDQKAYRLLRELEDTRALQALTIEESIAIGEALLTSSIMTMVRPTRERRLDLARTLGVRPERLSPCGGAASRPEPSTSQPPWLPAHPAPSTPSVATPSISCARRAPRFSSSAGSP